jgi:hypothetical protein
MRLKELAQVLDLRELTPTAPETAAPDATGAPTPDPDITRAYASDLMSDVLANAPAGGLLITLQVHLNVIAVAGHAGLRAVVFSSGRLPDEDVIERGAQEGLSLYVSPADTFTLAGRLYELGLRGSVA